MTASVCISLTFSFPDGRGTSKGPTQRGAARLRMPQAPAGNSCPPCSTRTSFSFFPFFLSLALRPSHGSYVSLPFSSAGVAGSAGRVGGGRETTRGEKQDVDAGVEREGKRRGGERAGGARRREEKGEGKGGEEGRTAGQKEKPKREMGEGMGRGSKGREQRQTRRCGRGWAGDAGREMRRRRGD